MQSSTTTFQNFEYVSTKPTLISELDGETKVARRGREKFVQPLHIDAPVGRKLDEYRSERPLETLCDGKKVFQRRMRLL
jgi:hypothetical protein